MNIGQFSLRRILLTMFAAGILCAVAAPWLRGLSIEKQLLVGASILAPLMLVGIAAMLLTHRRRQLVVRGGELLLRLSQNQSGKPRAANLPLFVVAIIAGTINLVMNVLIASQLSSFASHGKLWPIGILLQVLTTVGTAMMYFLAIQIRWKARLGTELRQRGIVVGLFHYYGYATLRRCHSAVADGVCLNTGFARIDIKVAPEDLVDVERILDEKLREREATAASVA